MRKSAVFLWIEGMLVCGMTMAEPLQQTYSWGYSGAQACPADYDGDGATDLGLYDSAACVWYVFSPARDSILAWNMPWGFVGATITPADFDGDGAVDLAAQDAATGNWYVYSLAKETVLIWAESWGCSTAVAVPGDYNGDGRAEKAVYDSIGGTWYILEEAPYSGVDTNKLWALYTNAVAHAMRSRAPREICHNLTALVTNNPMIDWRQHPTSGVWQVRMVSLMTARVAENYRPGFPTVLPTNSVAWLTAYPELKTFCRRYHGTNLLLRVKQLLGLHPLASNNTVVEYWVDPSLLLRPSPDPEITDNESQPDFAYSGNRFISVSSNYIALFEHMRAAQYDPDWPYPWSRIGYTYDWAEGTNRPIGLSEFVLHADWLNRMEGISVTVDVISVTNLAQYARIGQ